MFHAHHAVEHAYYNGWGRRCVNSPTPDPDLSKEVRVMTKRTHSHTQHIGEVG